MASALSAFRGVVAIFAGVECGVAGGAVSQPDAWFLAFIYSGCRADFYVQRAFGGVESVVCLDKAPRPDCPGAVSRDVGLGVTRECDRPAGEPGGGAVDQPAGVALSVAGHLLAARALAGRGVTLGVRGAAGRVDTRFDLVGGDVPGLVAASRTDRHLGADGGRGCDAAVAGGRCAEAVGLAAAGIGVSCAARAGPARSG